MDFSEKLQQLRKRNNLTQEQLAEKLFVSRTAISKWESGKGYPNIESLKAISQVFSISIDDLLSGEEILNLAANENRIKMNRMSGYVYALLDMMGILFIVLPLYGQPTGTIIQNVNLMLYSNTSPVIYSIYWTVYILMITLGVLHSVSIYLEKVSWLDILRRTSFSLDIFAVTLFFATREPYAGALLFSLFIIKISTMLKQS